MDTLPKGTIVTCSRKHHHIGALVLPVKEGDPLKLSALNFTMGQERIQGEPPICKICNGPYALDGMVHTISGWIPADPVIEGAKKPLKFNKGQIKKRSNPKTIEKDQAKALKKFRKDKRKALP